MKVRCADVSCKYWVGGKDKCAAKEVFLSWTSVMTTHNGRQEFLICRTREPDEAYLEMMKKWQDMLKGEASCWRSGND